jgi:hypothetical protein
MFMELLAVQIFYSEKELKGDTGKSQKHKIALKMMTMT